MRCLPFIRPTQNNLYANIKLIQDFRSYLWLMTKKMYRNTKYVYIIIFMIY